MNLSIPLRGRRPSARRSRGFTLLELVVTMVIAAILAAIAIPAYSSYVLKSHRTDAKTALTDMASLEERYFSTQNTYTATPSQLGYGAVAVPFPVGNGYYNITALTVTVATPPPNTTSAGTPATYTITATAIGNQTKDTCTTFTINSQGVQSATGSDPNANTDCWQQ
jgi:type IV pilus assembly protein PilE